MTFADVDAADRAALHKRVLVPLALSAGGYLLAYALSLFVVETVMGTGPVLSGLGLWLALRATRAHNRAATLLGLGHGVLALTLFVTVNALGWSPTQAREPFAIIGTVVGILTVALALLAVVEPRSGRDIQALAALRHTTKAEH